MRNGNRGGQREKDRDVDGREERKKNEIVFLGL